MPTSPMEDNPSTYMMDSSDVREVLRLTTLDHAITQGMGGPLPEQKRPAALHSVLDVGCGPGGWVLEVARRYPHLQVTGIDISRHMIEYAQAQAQAQNCHNATFRVVNVLKPWPFGDTPFDLINGRCLFSFIKKTAWPFFIRECLRHLQSGGILRLTEVESACMNGEACERLISLVNRAFWRAGQSFSPNGLHLGMTMVLPGLLREAGLKSVKSMAHAIEISYGTPAHDAFFQNSRFGYPLILPFLLKYELTAEKDYVELSQQALLEMQSEAFRGVQFLLTAWGTKDIS